MKKIRSTQTRRATRAPASQSLAVLLGLVLVGIMASQPLVAGAADDVQVAPNASAAANGAPASAPASSVLAPDTDLVQPAPLETSVEPVAVEPTPAELAPAEDSVEPPVVAVDEAPAPVLDVPAAPADQPSVAGEDAAPVIAGDAVTADQLEALPEERVTEVATEGPARAVSEPTVRAAVKVAFAVSGDTADQCNDTGSVGGDTITCTITITNNCTYNPATPATPTCQSTVVTEISCTGSAVCPTGETLILTEPVTVVTQCNNAGIGGASTVTCTVTVTNNLTGYPVGSAIDSTVLQCEDPGAVDTLTCTATPPGNNRPGDGGPGGQSVNQCNSSGGAGGTMTCTVTAPPSQSTGLPITITQCEGSGPTGASTVTCTATITNNLIDSIPGGGGPGGGGPGGGGPGGGGPGGGGPGGGGPGGPGGGETPPGGGETPPGGGETPPGGGETPPGGGETPPGGGMPPGGTPPDVLTPPDGGGSTPRSPNEIPFTGLNAMTIALVGLLAVLLGVGLRRITRSDRAHPLMNGEGDA